MQDKLQGSVESCVLNQPVPKQEIIESLGFFHAGFRAYNPQHKTNPAQIAFALAEKIPEQAWGKLSDFLAALKAADFPEEDREIAMNHFPTVFCEVAEDYARAIFNTNYKEHIFEIELLLDTLFTTP